MSDTEGLRMTEGHRLQKAGVTTMRELIELATFLDTPASEVIGWIAPQPAS